MLRTISPHEVAHAAFCAPHDLRQFRQAGYLTSIGERLGKGFLYSIDEAVSIAIAIHLARLKFQYSEAFSIAARHKQSVAAIVNGRSVSGDLILRIQISPNFSDAILRKGVTPLAQLTLDESLSLCLEVNFSAVARMTLDRINAFKREIAV